MRLIRTALELRMELDSDMETVLRLLNSLNYRTIRRGSGDLKSCLSKRLLVFIIELESVSVTLIYLMLSICLLEHGTLYDLARICSKTHCAALSNYPHLLFHQIDDQMLSILIKFTAVGIINPNHVTGILYH